MRRESTFALFLGLRRLAPYCVKRSRASAAYFARRADRMTLFSPFAAAGSYRPMPPTAPPTARWRRGWLSKRELDARRAAIDRQNQVVHLCCDVGCIHVHSTNEPEWQSEHFVCFHRPEMSTGCLNSNPARLASSLPAWPCMMRVWQALQSCVMVLPSALV